MRVCPQCGFHADERICPTDGFPMVAEGLFERGDNAPELVGRRFGDRYEVEALIGRGGMGWVFRALHLVMQQTVALKVMRRDVARDLSAVKRFSREARDCSRLRHHNTIKVHDFGVSDDGYPYLVMEYLEGRPLSRLIRDEGALPIERAVHITTQICASLDEAHDLGLVHRDLKPANVFLTRVHNVEDYVKVLDFGIAKSVDSNVAEALTDSGVVIGTPKYLSPEQAQARPLDRRSDIYSLGIILYELVSGRVPFDAPSTGALLAKQIYEPPPPLPEWAAGRRLPTALRALVASMLAKEPDERPATAKEVAARLQALVAAGPEADGLEETRPAATTGPDAVDTAELAPHRTPRLPEAAPRGPSTPALTPVLTAAPGEATLDRSADQSLPSLTYPTQVDPRSARRLYVATAIAGLVAAAVAFFVVRAVIGGPPSAPQERPALVASARAAAPAPDATAAPAPERAPVALPAPGPDAGGALAAGPPAEADARAAPAAVPDEAPAAAPDGAPAAAPDNAPAAAPDEAPAPGPGPEPVLAPEPEPVMVRLTTRPTGATVREGERALGRTPLTLYVLPTATRAITLERRGRVTRTVAVTAAAAPAVEVALDPAPRTRRPPRPPAGGAPPTAAAHEPAPTPAPRPEPATAVTPATIDVNK